MKQNEKWIIYYNEVVAFIGTNHRNPSKHNSEERYRFLNWLKQQRKLNYVDFCRDSTMLKRTLYLSRCFCHFERSRVI